MRYQECNWFTRKWRDRYYLLIPFQFIYYFLKSIKIEKAYENEFGDYEYVKITYVNKSFIWGILISEAQIKMKYYYTDEEVRERIKNKGIL